MIVIRKKKTPTGPTVVTSSKEATVYKCKLMLTTNGLFVAECGRIHFLYAEGSVTLSNQSSKRSVCVLAATVQNIPINKIQHWNNGRCDDLLER